MKSKQNQNHTRPKTNASIFLDLKFETKEHIVILNLKKETLFTHHFEKLEEAQYCTYGTNIIMSHYLSDNL